MSDKEITFSGSTVGEPWWTVHPFRTKQNVIVGLS